MREIAIVFRRDHSPETSGRGDQSESTYIVVCKEFRR
jgi:hypothetical protein